jgi:hypothetical protein
MSRNKKFEDLMPGLFSELTTASKITALFRSNIDLNLFARVPEMELIPVNGDGPPTGHPQASYRPDPIERKAGKHTAGDPTTREMTATLYRNGSLLG